MEFFKLMENAHSYLDILNPSSPEKLYTVGDILDPAPGSRIIDFGCGTCETFCLWADRYDISGTGVDISEGLSNRAKQKLSERGLNDRFKVINANGKGYVADRTDYDAALCIGATFIWGGYRETIQALITYVKPGAKLVIGEANWLKQGIPQEYFGTTNPDIALYEEDILRITLEEGYDIEYVVRASHDDWDRYNGGRWRGLIRWIAENPEHPDRQEIIKYHHESQEKYLQYEREYLGWAMYVLTPKTY